MKKGIALLLVLIAIVAYAYFLPYWNGVNIPESIEGDLDQLTLPAGFTIEYYVQNLEGARSMVLSESGILFVGTRKAGKVYAVLDNDKDFKADEVITIASGLTLPNGVALLDGDLYVAEVDKVLLFENIEENLRNPLPPIVLNDQFPSDLWHGWKFIRFGPDGKLYVPVGAPCNVCDPKEPYASILRMNPDGTQLETYVRGVRNTVGFDWHPETKELWFTDNGRDWWGDDVPPDELNHAPEQGMHFGFPYCHGDMVDDEFNTQKDCERYTNPKQELGPHVAGLGMRFYTGKMFPEKYGKGIFIAEHGSWNRKDPVGYRVVFVPLEGNDAVGYEPFVEGWLQENGSWGRPVDVQEMPDGSILISDDAGDAIYRVSYQS